MASYNRPSCSAYTSTYDPDELDYGEDELVMDVGADHAPLSGSEVSPEPLLHEREPSSGPIEIDDDEGSSSREEGEVEEDDRRRDSGSEALPSPSQVSSRSQSGQQSSSSSYSYGAPPRWVSTLAPELTEGPSSAPSANTVRRSADERPVRSPSWEGKKPKPVPHDRSFAQAGRSARRYEQPYSHARSSPNVLAQSTRPPLPPRRRNTFSDPHSPTRSSMHESRPNGSAFGPGGQAAFPTAPSPLPTPTASSAPAAQPQPSLLSRINFEGGEGTRARSNAKPFQARFVPAQDVAAQLKSGSSATWQARDAVSSTSRTPYPAYYAPPHSPPPHSSYPPHPSSYPPPSHAYYPPHCHYPPYSAPANHYAGHPHPHYPPAYSSPPSHPPYTPPLAPQPQPHSTAPGVDPTLAMTAMQVGLTVMAQQQTALAMQQRMAAMASTSAVQQQPATQAQPRREAETMAVPMRMGARSEKKLTGRQRARRKQLKEQEEARMHE